MMKKMKPFAIAALGLSIGLGGTSMVFAKGHDQGIADGRLVDDAGNPVNTGVFSRNGVIAGVNVPGIGTAGFAGGIKGGEDLGLCGGGFCGVVGDPGQTYGRDIVAVQRDLGVRRVIPIGAPGQNQR